MYDLSSEFKKFYDNEVVLPAAEKTKLREKKKLNVDRLIAGLDEYNKENNKSYEVLETREQGSVAMSTVTQNDSNDYDIDVAIIFDKDNISGVGHREIKNIIVDALKRKCTNFKKDPEALKNCVRIEYKDGYHVRRLLQREIFVKLGDITEIIMPRPVTDVVGKVVRMTDLKYPFDTDSIAENTATSVVLQKNDIILPSVGSVKPFLIADELDEKIYANRNMFVLRCKDIQPEYLYLYLNSEVCQTILDSQKLGCFISKITMKAAKEIPVIMPTKDEQEYSLQAQILTHIERRSYQASSDSMSRILTYWNALHKNDDKKPEKVEDILGMELLEVLKVHSTNQLQEMLHDDWKELNDCFRVGAYKATLILAGSILEAVLIDWLSEIKGHDYFTEDYVITDRNGRQKRADLIDYINEIKYIERPHWIDEATKAHEIRKKRNLVHAKLGINSDEINEETCRMVIDYLRDVIKTRGVEEQ